MREIKFRAWSTEQNKFIWTEMIYFKTDWTPNIRESTILMQYTWLIDKNGKEIYEWDILNEYDDENNEYFSWTYQVKYRDNWFWLDSRDANEYWFWDTDCMEIIWNIYSNPDLLK
jgi:uncharacterized phage protein (TIGR01671 family)